VPCTTLRVLAARHRGDGLEAGQDGGVAAGGRGVLGVEGVEAFLAAVVVEAEVELLQEGEFFLVGKDLGDGSDGAESGVVGDLFDQLGGFGFGLGW